MKIIKLTTWFMWHSFINGIKRAWNAFLVVAGIILVAIIAVAVVSMLAGNEDDADDADDATQISHTEEETHREINYEFDFVENEEGELILYEKGEAHEVGNLLIKGIIGLIAMFFIALAVSMGAKNGVNIFTMSDVNFLFPSPTPPQSVLLFKMIGQIGTALLGSLYLLGQFPNMCLNAGLPIIGAFCLFFAYILLQFASKIISVLTYLLLQDHPGIKKFVGKYALFLTGLPVIVGAAMYYGLHMSAYDCANAVLGNVTLSCIPVWGWLCVAGAYAFEGNYLLFLVYFVLTIIGIIALGVIAWRIPADFYEDALASAMEISANEENIKTMAAGGISSGVKHTSKSDEKKWEKRRNKAVVFSGYEGAKVFFGKTILNRKRMHPLRGLWSPTCATYTCMMAGIIFAQKFLLGIDEIRMLSLSAGMLVLIIMFFRSFANPLQVELSQNFIYMIPEKPSKLLGWGMAGQVLDGALDLLPGCIIMGAVTLDPLLALCMYLVLLSMHIFFGMTALMINLVVSNYLPPYLSRMLQSIIRLIPFLPVVLIFAVGMGGGAYLIPSIICVAINVLASLIVFWPCPYHLHKGKR